MFKKIKNKKMRKIKNKKIRKIKNKKMSLLTMALNSVQKVM